MTEKKVTVYSVPTCPFCKKAKEYLDSNSVKYTDYNVAEDREKLDEMMKISSQRGVPVIVSGDKMLVGFNEKQVAEALAADG